MVPTRFPFAARLLVCALFMTACSVAAAAADVPTAASRAHNWLTSQIRPSGLIDSYRDKSDVCYTYDQAVGATALLARGDAANAKRILDAMAALQNDDGSWYHAYSCNTPTVLARSRYTGAVSWVALAMANYAAETGDTITFDIPARRAMNWILLWLQSDGGINGGLDSSGVPIRWASTEHNEDAFSSLRFFSYAEYASVHTFLDSVYNVTQQRWNQGRNDTLNPLDVNPLGVLALGPAGKYEYWRSLDYALRTHRSVQTAKRGRLRVSTDGFDFNADRNDIWFEGTAQMALALRAAGRAADAGYFLQQVANAQQNDGGIPYSLKGTFNGDFTMSTATAVASTGWFVIAAQNLNPMQPGN